MMSTANATVIPHGVSETENITLGGNGFFPEISIDHFREVMRVGPTIIIARVKYALIDALLKVQHDLKPLTDIHSDYQKLADVPAEIFADESALVFRYRSAIYTEAKATLTERYRDFDSTQSGHDDADKLDLTIEDYRKASREHIRALLGKPRTTIGLL